MTNSPEEDFPEFIGSSAAIQEVTRLVAQVAPNNVDVLILGETGTGKELVARAIHSRSPRRDAKFVAVDCGAIPENLMESEFFGYEKGAFTGAQQQRTGLLEYANGGVFFLDEIAELPLLLQAKLLRTLQERTLRRVGGREEIALDVRVIAATGKDLKAMVREGTFREDLYYRINVVSINLPPLRDRGDDLGLMAEHFARRFGVEMGLGAIGITPDAWSVLAKHDWPGNVRELQNIIRRGLALTQNQMIGVEDLPTHLLTANSESHSPSEGFFAAREACVARFEREYLTELLKTHQGNVKAAAEQAQLPRGTLYRLLKNHELDAADFR